MNCRTRKTLALSLAADGIHGRPGLERQGRPGAGVLVVAEARVGRPLTPMSYAGVARRTTRRAVVYGGAAAAAAAGAYAVTPGCAQVVDAYGQVTRGADGHGPPLWCAEANVYPRLTRAQPDRSLF